MPGARVAVFDRADRPGGRPCSRDLGDGMGIVELGAGRFSPNSHPQLASLTAHYGQATKSFEYRLTPIHSGLSEQAIILMSEICNEIDKNYHSTELIQRHSISLRRAAVRIVGKARFDLLVDLCGYDTLNHPDLTFEEGFRLLRQHPETSILFGRQDNNWRALVGGLSSLVDSLVEDLGGQAELNLEHELVGISTEGGGDHILHFETAYGQKAVCAGKVLFALPIWNSCRINGLNLPTMVCARIQSVPLIKAYFAYAERWWGDFGLEGRCLSTTSMFRKIYFPKDANYVLIYSDGTSANKLHESFVLDSDIHTTFLQMISDALPFGTEIAALPNPQDSDYRFWPHGISFWRNGLNLIPTGHWQIGQGAAVCSDLFTSKLGWIEGALESAESAVRVLCENCISSPHN